MRARSQRGANNRAKIVRVFNSIEQDEKSLRSLRRKQVFKFERRLRCRQRGNALMFARANQPVDLHAVFKSHRNAFRPRELHHRFHTLAMHYRPRSALLGAVMSVAGILLACVLALRGAVRTSSLPAQHPPPPRIE